MLLEYDKVTQSSPLLSNARSVGPSDLLSEIQLLVFDSISKLPILFPIISVNQIVLLSGDSMTPIIPELFVGIL